MWIQYSRSPLSHSVGKGSSNTRARQRASHRPLLLLLILSSFLARHPYLRLYVLRSGERRRRQLMDRHRRPVGRQTTDGRYSVVAVIARSGRRERAKRAPMRNTDGTLLFRYGRNVPRGQRRNVFPPATEQWRHRCVEGILSIGVPQQLTSELSTSLVFLWLTARLNVIVIHVLLKGGIFIWKIHHWFPCGQLNAHKWKFMGYKKHIYIYMSNFANFFETVFIR